MDNSQRFLFSDFTFKEYESILMDANSFYSFITHNEFLNKKHDKPFLIWRHDIDMSIENAVRFAEIENRLGLTTTYFIHLHSEYYHFYEKESFDSIKKIQALGHHIGLHFDTHFYDINSESDLDLFIEGEKSLIENVFNCNVDVFSFHNTNEFILSCNKLTYGGLTNTYSNVFQKELAYCSDSYGVWRFERLCDLIKQRKYNSLQVLTHPELWSDEVSSPYERVLGCIFGRAQKVKSLYDGLLERNSRDKIDWK